ncbi:hypothetical protein FMUAM8_50510 [Nocardia cyriacigeorgica]|nr:hypothetical protein FMUAM8_50510 [Nocardia cyriacigeorgica]
MGSTVSSASVTSWAVISTAVSVGPYMLCTRAPVTARARWAMAAGRVSPEQKMWRRVGTSCSSATNAASIDGTKCATVMDSRRIRSAR